MSKVLKNTAIYSISNLTIALSSFILLPIYTSYMSVGDFGVISSMQTFSSILAVFMTFAIEHSIFRLYYDYTTELEKQQFVGTLISSVLLIGICVVVISFIGNSFVNKVFPSISFYPYYFFTIIYTFILVIVSILRNIKQVKHQALNFAFLSLIIFFSTAGLTLLFLVSFSQGASGYVKAMFYGILIALPFAVFLARKDFIICFKPTFLKGALLYSLPMLPSLVSAWVLNLSDRVFIDNYINQTAIGIYSLGYRFASIIILATTAFLSAYTPLFYELANNLDEKNSKKKLVKYNFAIVVVISLTTLGICLFAKEILVLFFKPEYYDSLLISRLFCLSFLLSQITGLYNLMVYQNKRTWQVAIAIIITAIINIFLNWYFIPLYGIIAAAVNSIIGSLINFVLMHFFAKKNYYVSIGISRIVFMFVIMLFVMYVFPLFELKFPIFSFLAKLLLYLSILTVFFYSFRTTLNPFYLSLKTRLIKTFDKK